MGFSLSGALSGGLGGFLAGGPAGAFAGAALGGLGSDIGREKGSQQSFVDPRQQQSLSNLYNFSDTLLNRFQNNPQSLVAGFDPLQVQGQQSLLNAAGNMPSFNQPLQSLLNPANVNLQQASSGQLPGVREFSPVDPLSTGGANLQQDLATNPFYQQQLQSTLNPFIRNFQQEILPSIRQQAVGVGQVGGSREGIAQGIATQGLLGTLGDITAQMGARSFETAQDAALRNQALMQQAGTTNIDAALRSGQLQQSGDIGNINASLELMGLQQGGQLGALGLAPSIAGLSLLPGQIQSDIGGQRQALNQQRINAPFNLASQFANLIGQPTTLSQGQQLGQGPNLLELFAGGKEIAGQLFNRG